MVKKISPIEAKSRVDAEKALLVCIYADAKFNATAHLDGAIPMSEFELKKPTLSKDQEIIFY
jgi:hypothetical protein